MYDIPTAEGAKRRTLQRYVRHLGFHQLQKSVWVYPFECREDVGRLVRGLGIHESECRLVTVTDMGDDRSLRAYFGV
jgi:DNA-binding transcriptional regulator PaaX